MAISLLTTSCASHDDSASAPQATASASAPHGYVEGAQEKAEQQSRLLLNDPATGDTRVLDLITAKTHKVSRTSGTIELTTDGRFGYFHTAGSTRVLDSGAWMVDHGDHVHYYRAAIRDVGRVPGGPGTRVRSDAAVTAVTDEDGRARIYRRAGLEKGKVGSARPLPGTHAGVVVPYARIAREGIETSQRLGRHRRVVGRTVWGGQFGRRQTVVAGHQEMSPATTVSPMAIPRLLRRGGGSGWATWS